MLPLFQLHLHLEQKHQPMRLALVTVLTDQPRQVQIRWREYQANFLKRLAAGTDIRRFANIHFQLAAARAPKAPVRLLRALEQQNFLLLIKAIEQRGDFVGQ